MRHSARWQSKRPPSREAGVKDCDIHFHFLEFRPMERFQINSRKRFNDKTF
ncbi:hypothetical protein COAQ111491_09880 [Comamonas aquatilis]